MPSAAIVFGPSVPVAVTVPVGRTAPVSVDAVCGVTVTLKRRGETGNAFVAPDTTTSTGALLTVSVKFFAGAAAKFASPA